MQHHEKVNEVDVRAKVGLGVNTPAFARGVVMSELWHPLINSSDARISQRIFPSTRCYELLFVCANAKCFVFTCTACIQHDGNMCCAVLQTSTIDWPGMKFELL